MTVIAWDTKTLAADRRCHDGTDAIVGYRTKLVRIDADRIGGFSGTQPIGQMLIDWVRAGASIEAFPKEAKEKEDRTTLMVIHRSGRIELYCNFPYPSVLDNGRAAAGCAAQEARVAMHCGKTAAEAIEVAALFDPWIGGGVDTLTFDEP